MTTPVPAGSIRLYDAVEPALTAGVYRLSSSVEVSQAGNAGNQFAPAAPDRTHLEIGGPRFRLNSAEIAAVHPAGGATGAFGDRLPHVVIGRHTLPWERRTPGGAPWLALLVAKTPGEATLVTGPLQATAGQAVYTMLNRVEPTDPQEPVTVARFTDVTVLRKLLPSQNDVALLAHVRQVNLADTALNLGDDDGWFSVVAANRLPLTAAGTNTPYTALLVSLEGRDDLWNLPATGAAPPLLVVHSWAFTSGEGGTFEALAADLDVAAFPTAPATLAYTDRTGNTAPANYRGPLAAGPPAEPDISNAAAYELGRLLGTADGRFTREIVGWHRAVDAAARTQASAQLVAESLPPQPFTAAAATATSERLSATVTDALRGTLAGLPKVIS